MVLEYSSLSWAECILIEVPDGYFKGGVLCSEYITCIPIPFLSFSMLIQTQLFLFICGCHRSCFSIKAQLLLTCSHSDLKKTNKQARFLGGGV